MRISVLGELEHVRIIEIPDNQGPDNQGSDNRSCPVVYTPDQLYSRWGTGNWLACEPLHLHIERLVFHFL